MEIAALVSGGVDSSVVVHLLKEAGYDPTIFYIRIGMEDKDGYIGFDADICVRVMKELDWKWAGENVDVDKFVRTLKSYSYEVVKNLLEEFVNENVNECDYFVESGGIKVEGHLEIIDGKKHIVISPKFILEQDSFEICIDSI